MEYLKSKSSGGFFHPDGPPCTIMTMTRTRFHFDSWRVFFSPPLKSTAFFRVLPPPSSLHYDEEAEAFCGSNPLAIACAASMSSDQSPFASLQSERERGWECQCRARKIILPRMMLMLHQPTNSLHSDAHTCPEKGA